MDKEKISTKGWNWGYYQLDNESMTLTHDSAATQKAFTLKYKDIGSSNDAKENEVQIEF